MMHHACKSNCFRTAHSCLLRTSREHLRKLFLNGWPAISSLFLFQLFFLRGIFRILFNLSVYGGISSKILVKMERKRLNKC